MSDDLLACRACDVKTDWRLGKAAVCVNCLDEFEESPAADRKHRDTQLQDWLETRRLERMNGAKT